MVGMSSSYGVIDETNECDDPDCFARCTRHAHKPSTKALIQRVGDCIVANVTDIVAEFMDKVREKESLEYHYGDGSFDCTGDGAGDAAGEGFGLLKGAAIGGYGQGDAPSSGNSFCRGQGSGH